MCVYPCGEYCPPGKRKAEVPWQVMGLFSSSFLGKVGVCLLKTAPEAYMSLPGSRYVCLLKEQVMSFIFLTIIISIYLLQSWDTCVNISLMQNINKYKQS